MIDVENKIYNAVRESVIDQYPDVFMVGEYVQAPSSFPCVSFVEVYNSVNKDSSTNEEIENHAIITYEANVYSNKIRGKKAQCRDILRVIDDKMSKLGFTRNFSQSVPNIADATIYRMYARYQAIVDNNDTIYRR